MSLAQTFGELSLAARIAISVLLVAQLALQIIGLLDLKRREETAGSKWVWALVIVLGGIVGASAYLAVGRKSARRYAADGEVRSGGESAARRAVDDLYGPDDRV